MAIQLSMDIHVLVIKDLYKDYLNDPNVTGAKMHLYSVTHNDGIIKVGNVKHNGGEYTVCIVKDNNLLYNNLFVSDFAFETQMIFNTREHPELYIERDLKLVRSRETRSGFNLSDYFNGEVTNDTSHHDFFNGVINLLVEKNEEITTTLFKDLNQKIENYLYTFKLKTETTESK